MRDPAVTALVDGLESPFRPAVNQIRNELLAADSAVSECVKWNSPNFRFAGADRITLNLRPGKPMIVVMHCGAKTGAEAAAMAPEGLPFTWKGKDRAQMEFASAEAWKAIAAAACAAMIDWMRNNNQE